MWDRHNEACLLPGQPGVRVNVSNAGMLGMVGGEATLHTHHPTMVVILLPGMQARYPSLGTLLLAGRHAGDHAANGGREAYRR